MTSFEVVIRKGVGEEDISVLERSNKRKMSKFQVRWNEYTQSISPTEYNYKTELNAWSLHLRSLRSKQQQAHQRRTPDLKYLKYH